ncbi:MAG: hypothetical protein MJZ49_05795 [Bacteroidales bacterium]|nr:hypothetical protein [Bacteroidales bacterium]
MERKKNTNVIALTDFSAAGNSAVRHAATLAIFFESSLTIVTRFSFHKKEKINQKNAEFEQIIEEFAPKVSIVVDENPYDLASIHAMAESANNIMFVLGVARKGEESCFNASRAMKFIAPSRLPVMSVSSQPPRDENWQNVLLTIEIDQPHKEKSLWAGYFNRYGHSTVHILHNSYQDELSKDKLEDALEFVDRLYKNLEISPLKHEISPRAYVPDSYAVENADTYNAAVLVLMTTTHKTFIDRLFGTREQQLVGNPQGLPVLCINERDDLFVLCT